MANKTTKIFAFLALFGIIISVVWTGLLIFFWDSAQKQEKTLSKEEIQKLIKNNEIKITNSGAETK